MFSGFIVLFDACVLYQAPLRDLVIELGLADLYRAKWTDRIHDEWIGSLVRKRPNIAKEKLERTRQLINESIEDCLVTDYENLTEKLTLPDSNDCHILAAAIKAHAQIIVTCNIRDFPKGYLDSFGIEVQHPDIFFLNQSDLQLHVFLAAVKRIRLSLKRPAKTPEEYLGILRKSELANTAEFLEDYIDLI